MPHYRIHGFLTGEILNSKVVSEFSFYLRVIKTKLFGNILMEALAPLAPPLTAVLVMILNTVIQFTWLLINTNKK